jgi:DNA-binding LytR/AlgR family response regulator
MSNTKLNILIVEDDLSFALELEMLLEAMGYHTSKRVDNGEEAYEFIYEYRPDLILMDINLKGSISGTELGQRILTFEIPIIYITAFQNEKMFKAAQQSKMVAYLVKPISKFTLQAAIANAIEAALHKTQARLNDVENIFSSDYLFIKKDGIYKKIYIFDIQYIYASNNYCKIYMLEDNIYFIRISLDKLEHKLPSKMFLRIHRQYLINLAQIDTVDFGACTLLINGVEEMIPISRSKRSVLEAVLWRIN